MWIREISDQEMAMLGATPPAMSNTRSPALSAKINLILKTDLPIKAEDIAQGELESPEVQMALVNPNTRPSILGRMEKSAVVESIKSDESLFGNKKLNKPAKDSKNGVLDGMRDSGILSARVQIRTLKVVLRVMKKISSIDLGHVKDMTVSLAKGKWKKAANKFKNALLDVAGAALYWSANALSGGVIGTIMGASKSVIKQTIQFLMIRYNNRCGGEAGERVGDFSDVGKEDRQNGLCKRAKGEPKWIDTGFRPYIWRGGFGGTKWNYTRIGISKNKKNLKDLEDERKKRGDRSPPKFKGGGKNTLDLRPPSAFRDRASGEVTHGDR